MARGPEGDFWKKVRKAWPGHALRIEASDGEVPAGTPDTVLSVGFKGGYVELKVWPDDCSAQQIAWHADAMDRGAYAMVLGELPGGRVWLGPADLWTRFVQLGQVPNGKNLHSALRVIACALSGNGGNADGMVGCSAKGSSGSAT